MVPLPAIWKEYLAVRIVSEQANQQQNEELAKMMQDVLDDQFDM
jgi:hypothetical protein